MKLWVAALHIMGAAAFAPHSGSTRCAVTPACTATLQINGFDQPRAVNSAAARAAARVAKEGGTEDAAPSARAQQHLESPPRRRRQHSIIRHTAADTLAAQRVQLAVDAAAAAAAKLLLSSDGEITSTTVASVIDGFALKIRELVPGSGASAGAPTRAAPITTKPRQSNHDQAVASSSRETLTRVLAEFCEGDFARRLCDECNIQPLIGSPSHTRISYVFDSVKLSDAKLTVRLHAVFERRSGKLLEHLVKHLRASMPQIERIEYHSKSPPSTRTIMI